MAKLTAVIGADTSRFVEEVKSARYMLDKFVSDTQSAIDATENMTSVTNEQVNAYKNVVSSLEKIVSGTMSSAQQQKALGNVLQELKIQWSNLSEEAKSGEFGKMVASSLSESQIALSQLSEQIKQVNSEIGNSAGPENAKRQLVSVTRELTNLTLQYRNLSDAEKQSAEGQELARKLDELREKAGALKDTVGDVQDEIKVMASDTPNLDVFNAAIGIGADALSTYSSIIAKVTGDEKALKSAIATVMAVQSAANLMTKVTNALQSSSVIMLKVRAIQEKAAAAAIRVKTAAETKGTLATKGATVAQTAFNAVASANPYVLLAMAVVGVGAALISFAKSSYEATAAEKKAQEAAQAAKQSWDDFKNTASNAGATLLATYSKLQAEWKNLKSVHEKNQWIKDNKEEFNKLGVEINDIGDAENFLIENTDAVVQAFMLRGKAAAYAAKAEEMWGKYIDKELEYNKRKVSAGDEVPKQYRPESVSRDDNGYGTTANGGRFNVDNALTLTSFTQKGADEYNEKLRAEIGLSDQAQAEITQFTENQVELERKAQELLKSKGVRTKTTGTGGNTTTSGKGGKNPLLAEGSLAALENQLSELQKKYKNGFLPELNTDDYLKEVKRLEKAIEDKKFELGLIPIIPKGSLEDINKQISAKQAELKLAVDNESRQKIQHEIDQLTNQKREIELVTKPVINEKDIEELFNDIASHEIEVKTKAVEGNYSLIGASKSEKASSNANQLREELEFGKQILASYKEQYDLIKQKQSAGAELNESELKLVGIYDNTTKAVNRMSDAYEEAAESARQLKMNADLSSLKFEALKTGVSNIGSFNSSIGSLHARYKDFDEQMKDKDSFQQFSAGLDLVVSTINTAIQTYENINKMIQLFDTISQISAAKKIATNSTMTASDTAMTATESANTQVKVANDQLETLSELGKLGVKKAGALAGATASGASMPFPTNLIAIDAGIAAVEAAFALVFSAFAEGGIVNSGSKTGDYNLVRVNGGEMILNGTQQKRLFNLLNGEVGYAAINNKKNKVVFEIKGSKLAGTLKNYYSKTNKL